LTQRVRDELIDPLCISALNTPADEASGQVFLRVLQDAMFGERGGSNLLIPRVDLGALLPDAAAQWLLQRRASVLSGQRVQQLERQAEGWTVDGEAFDSVLLACPPGEAARLVEGSGMDATDWCAQARQLQFAAIATVYLEGGDPLPAPMLALRPGPGMPA